MNDNDFDMLLKARIKEDIQMPDKINQLFLNFEAEVIKNEEMKKAQNTSKAEVKKESIISKINRIIITLSALLATLVGGGAVYAAKGGTINGVPVAEWFGIKFSSNYNEYEEDVENIILENELARLDLESSVCDDGFTILKFNLKLKEVKEEVDKSNDFQEEIEEYKNYAGYSHPETKEKVFVHFNEEVTYELEENNGVKVWYAPNENHNLIIDEKEYYIAGSEQGIEEINKNNEYTIYQMYFLSNDELKNKDKFKISLKNITIEKSWGEQFIHFDDNLEINLSKSKALKNTKTIKCDNNEFVYGGMTKTLSEVKITPLQNIVKFSTELDLSKIEYYFNITNSGNDKFNYVVTDQNGNNLRSFTIISNIEFVDNAGNREIIDLSKNNGEFSIDNKDGKLYYTEYIAIEQNQLANEFNINIYYSSAINYKNIGSYIIDLNTNNITYKANNGEEVKSDDNSIDTNIIPSFESDNTEWEEYPEDFNSYFEGLDDEEIKYIAPMYPIQLKTFYSLIDNKLYESIEELMAMGLADFGESYDFVSRESNYDLYQDDYNGEILESYSKPIEFKIAKLSPNDSEIGSKEKDLTTLVKDEYDKLMAKNYNQELEYFYELNKIVIMNGNNTSKDDYLNNARAKKIKVTIDGNKEYIFDLKDTNKAQVLDFDYRQDVSRPVSIKIEVLEAYKGKVSQDIYISDIEFDLPSNLYFGI